MAKRDIDQPEPQRGGPDRERDETRDESTPGPSDDVRGIADEEDDDFEEGDEVEDLEDEESDEM